MRELGRNLLLYGMIGAFASGTDAFLFFVFTYGFGFNPLIVNCLTVITGMTISFLLNRKYNFKVEDHAVLRAAIFFCVGICGLLLSQLILAFGSAHAIEPMVAKIASIFIVAIFQFLLNKFVSFGLRFE